MSLTGSIYIGMSGLQGFSKELQNISNNVANLNTPGFKGSDSQFASLFSQDGGSARSGAESQGNGLQVLPAVVNFSHGQIAQTGVSTNMANSGNNFFVLKDPKTGQIYYTQDGQFQFDGNGTLIDSTGNYNVQALTTSGGLVDLTQNGLQSSQAKASTSITLTGNISSTTSPATINAINVIDSNGTTHTLTATFTKSTTATNTWSVSISDANGTVSSGGTFVFNGGFISTSAANNSYSFNYAPAGASPLSLNLVLAPTTTSQASGSTLGVQAVDGNLAGTITGSSFNQSGMLILAYSNAQTINGPSVALANFSSTSVLQQAGNNAFTASDNNLARLGVAGPASPWGIIQAGAIQGSNVDLSTEFSNIIITQRGYQAASEIVSTVNQMMQNALDMKR